VVFRSRIQEETVANGAEFRKDLIKSVTHLIAREAKGEKYKFAMQWNIKVVSKKWFSESLERGMVLDEDLYHPSVPLEKQGVGAWNRSMEPVPAKLEEPADIPGPRPRKIRRIASTKLVDQNEGIWDDIVAKQSESIEDPESKSVGLSAAEGPSFKDCSVMQEPTPFTSDTTVAGRRGSGSRLTDDTPAEQNEGFLQDSYFFIYGFTPKQVSITYNFLFFLLTRL
jgi:DNA replication regulator DPB11